MPAVDEQGHTILSGLNGYRAFGSHAQDATISSATTLTKPAGATHIMMQATAQNVRYLLDGTNPTTSKGFVLVPGSPIHLPVPGADVRVIEESATATIEYQWFN